MYEILSELKDIAARPDGITCACGSGSVSVSTPVCPAAASVSYRAAKK